MATTNLQHVEFQGDRLVAFEREGEVFIAIKPIAEGLGLSWAGQLERLKRDPIMAEAIRVIRIEGPGGARETTVLRLDLLQGWLFGIDASRVKADARDRVLAYKRDCFAVLHAHFYAARTPTLPAPVASQETIPAYVKRSLVNEARMTFGGAAARELWRSLGLPITPAMESASPQGTLDLQPTSRGNA